MRICLHGQCYEKDESEIVTNDYYYGLRKWWRKEEISCWWKIQMHFIKKDNPQFYIHQDYCREYHNRISIPQSSWNWILILPNPVCFEFPSPKDPAGRMSAREMVSCPVTVITEGFARLFPRFNFGLLPRFHHLTFPSLKTQSLQTTFPLPMFYQQNRELLNFKKVWRLNNRAEVLLWTGRI